MVRRTSLIGPSLLSLTALVVGAAALAACSSDDNSGGASQGTGATSAGGQGPGGDGAGGGATGGEATGGGAGGQGADECPVTGGPASGVASEDSVATPSEPLSPHIVTDQFGYRPASEKIAVIRSPITGFDAANSFDPGGTYALVDAATGTRVLEGAPSAWNGGAEDPQSGDQAWWFDFSSVETPGVYYVLDVDQGVRGPVFRIASDVYREVFKAALKTFYYQRVGFEKTAEFAGDWADGASHVGPLQDLNARRYDAPGDASTERDVSGGWYDAGDYNKYTAWTSDYVIKLLRAYEEKPSAFGDDVGIPESGNCVPDVLDEVKWGVDHLVRLQNDDGSVLSIVGLAGGSPPSSATGPSLYGTPNTSGTLAAASAYAYAATVFAKVPALAPQAEDLRARAGRAWQWAEANPELQFRNNDAGSGTQGLGAGQQEVLDPDGNYDLAALASRRFEAAVMLFEATGDTTYQSYIDANYSQMRLMSWNFAFPFAAEEQTALLRYATMEGATPAVAADIRNVYGQAMEGEHNLQALTGERDPYLAYMKDYTWGSNNTKAKKGTMFQQFATFGISGMEAADASRAAERYVHYVHGVNPLQKVFLSNMSAHGAENSVTEFFHSWFAPGTPYSTVGESVYGPAPGFLVGGPNPNFSLDGCCPSGCGSDENNALCSLDVTPPLGQPAQKSYKDFNDSWPANSWSVTENSNGYQVSYLRLLSKFVE